MAVQMPEHFSCLCIPQLQRRIASRAGYDAPPGRRAVAEVHGGLVGQNFENFTRWAVPGVSATSGTVPHNDVHILTGRHDVFPVWAERDALHGATVATQTGEERCACFNIP